MKKKPTEICGLCQTLFFFHGTTSLARQKFAALIYIQGFFVEYRLDLGAGPWKKSAFTNRICYFSKSFFMSLNRSSNSILDIPKDRQSNEIKWAYFLFLSINHCNNTTAKQLESWEWKMLFVTVPPNLGCFTVKSCQSKRHYCQGFAYISSECSNVNPMMVL